MFTDDELIYIPGKWTYRNISDAGFRITNIYVSTNKSVFNGQPLLFLISELYADHRSRQSELEHTK